MNLSQFYEPVGHRRGPGCDHRKPSQQVGQVEAAVEAPAELGEVARQMLVANGMVGSVDGVLDVAEHGVDPLERFAPAQATRPADDRWLVCATSLGDCGKAAQSIGA